MTSAGRGTEAGATDAGRRLALALTDPVTARRVVREVWDHQAGWPAEPDLIDLLTAVAGKVDLPGSWWSGPAGGRAVAVLRRELGLTGEQTAEVLRVPPAVVAELEAVGAGLPTVDPPAARVGHGPQHRAPVPETRWLGGAVAVLMCAAIVGVVLLQPRRPPAPAHLTVVDRVAVSPIPRIGAPPTSSSVAGPVGVAVGPPATNPGAILQAAARAEAAAAARAAAEAPLVAATTTSTTVRRPTTAGAAPRTTTPVTTDSRTTDTAPTTSTTTTSTTTTVVTPSTSAPPRVGPPTGSG